MSCSFAHGQYPSPSFLPVVMWIVKPAHDETREAAITGWLAGSNETLVAHGKRESVCVCVVPEFSVYPGKLTVRRCLLCLNPQCAGKGFA